MRTTLLVLVAFICSIPAQAQSVVEAFPDLSFDFGVDIQNAGDGSDRLFVVEQEGIIRVFENDPLITDAQVFIDIRSRVLSDSRFGLLGLAFHPQYADNGYFYVHYTAANPQRSVIARYTVDAADSNAADLSSELVLLEVGQPHNFHNGGALAFGPDGYLYIAMGDGGPGRDPSGHGQNRGTLLGTVLRIDVDNPDDGLNYGIPDDNPFVGNTNGYREEIWAWGLRNPWRISFDLVTGWLWAGENGEDGFEEIDLIESGKNYGWKIVEASQCFSPAVGCSMAGLEPPVWAYGGTTQRRSVIGGYLYRGQMNPELVGKYIYGDFLLGRIWALDYDGENPASNQQIAFGVTGLGTFGLDEAGEIYFSNIADGKIYRFAPTATRIEGEDVQPAIKLLPNYPNPFAGPTTIPFSLQQPGHVRLEVYDLMGRRIKVLVDDVLPTGTHTLQWDGKNGEKAMPAGVYFYRLISGDARETRTMTRMK